jgi:predicted enzyme related to lactoylglutathione lyase
MADSPNPVAWFEIPVADMARAKAFYEHVLGVSLEPMQMGPADMAMFPSAQGPAGCLIKSDGYTPSHDGTLLYFAVADINATLAKAQGRGGKTLLPKLDIGEFGFVAHFQDSEGNRVAVHSQT